MMFSAGKHLLRNEKNTSSLLYYLCNILLVGIIRNTKRRDYHEKPESDIHS